MTPSGNTPSPIDKALLYPFRNCLRYIDSPPLLKPLKNPIRFIRNRLRQKLRNPEGTIETVRTFHMDRFHIVAGEIVSEFIACHGIYESNLTAAFLQLIKPGQTVLDVGMHLGYFSTLMARLVGPDGKVHSFEPTPSTREIATLNTGQFPNIRVHPNAMWSDRVKMTFHDYGVAHMAFNSVVSARLDREIDTVNEIQVESISLDEFRSALGKRIDVIKIDAETAESEIIRGGKNTLASDRPVITLEVGDTTSSPGQSRDLVDAMSELNYQPWEFIGASFKKHVPKEAYTYDNLIFAPLETPLA